MGSFQITTKAEAASPEEVVAAFKRAQPKAKKTARDTTGRLGFVLTSEPVLPSPKAIVEAAAELGESGLELLPPGNAERLAFKHPLGHFSITLVKAKHPNAAKLLPGPFTPSREEIEATTAFAVVILAGGPGTPRQRDLTMTRLVGAVAVANKALAAKVAHGVTFHKTEALAAAIKEAGKDGVPIPGGIDFTVVGKLEGQVSLLSHGMTRYDREDIYVTEANEKDAYELGRFFAKRLLSTEERIPDGDTTGRSAEERLKVIRVANPVNPYAKAIKLDR